MKWVLQEVRGEEEIKFVCSINIHHSIYIHTSKVRGPLTRQGAQEAAGSTEGGKLKSASHAQKRKIWLKLHKKQNMSFNEATVVLGHNFQRSSQD